MITAEQADAVWRRADCLFDESTVESALDSMAVAITEVLQHSNPLMISIMHGGLITSGKLATRLSFPLQLDYLHATRYRGETRGGELHWKVTPSESLRERTVLLVDDILDEGATLKRVVQYCQQQGSEAVFTAVLLDKRHERREAGISADFVGLQVEDRYLFGYGMDYKGYLRNAAGIYAIVPEDM